MTVKSNNATIYGIQDDLERYLWITYLLIVLISSLLGDSIVLIASNRCHAFKLNKFIIAVIQHMAVCDLMISGCFIIPTIISIVADGWILGTNMAYLQKYLEFWVFPMNYILVGVLTTSKYLLVRYPLRTRSWSKNKAHCVSLVFWGTFAAISLTSLIRRPNLIFDYTSYEFDTDYDPLSSPNSWDQFARIISYIVFCIPVIVILVTLLTLRFLVEAREVSRRGGGSLRWHGILTVVMTGVVFCVSSLPYTVYKIMSVLQFEGDFMIQFERNSEYLTFLNVMSNFYIYSMTIPSFRNFLWSKILNFHPWMSPDGSLKGINMRTSLHEITSTQEEGTGDKLKVDLDSKIFKRMKIRSCKTVPSPLPEAKNENWD